MPWLPFEAPVFFSSHEMLGIDGGDMHVLAMLFPGLWVQVMCARGCCPYSMDAVRLCPQAGELIYVMCILVPEISSFLERHLFF